jgi:Zn-dependent protease
MIPIQHKASLVLWLIVPVCAWLLYPHLMHDSTALEGLTIALLIYVLFLSVVVHELCHGLAAYWCGDSTAKDAGRLTFNPLNHISLVGTIIVPFVLYYMQAAAIFGWARPVPFNPINLRQYPRDQVLLAVAGPLSNFTLAYVCFNLYLIIGFGFNHIFPDSAVYMQLDLFAPVVLQNVPFEAGWFVLFTVLNFGVVLNVILGVFNVIPFPPLDGSWLLKALLPKKAISVFGKLQAVGFILLLVALQFHLLQIFFYPALLMLLLLQQIANFCLG